MISGFNHIEINSNSVTVNDMTDNYFRFHVDFDAADADYINEYLSNGKPAIISINVNYAGLGDFKATLAAININSSFTSSYHVFSDGVLTTFIFTIDESGLDIESITNEV